MLNKSELDALPEEAVIVTVPQESTIPQVSNVFETQGGDDFEARPRFQTAPAELETTPAHSATAQRSCEREESFFKRLKEEKRAKAAEEERAVQRRLSSMDAEEREEYDKAETEKAAHARLQAKLFASSHFGQYRSANSAVLRHGRRTGKGMGRGGKRHRKTIE